VRFIHVRLPDNIYLRSVKIFGMEWTTTTGNDEETVHDKYMYSKDPD